MSPSKSLLDLRNDAVFKIFFSKEENRSLLISFLEAVLQPRLPIQSVKLLNPMLPKSLIEEKQSVLDLLISFTDGTQIDVEMQVERTDGFLSRILYYWAKLHQGQLKNGESYRKLAPTVSICILDYIEFQDGLEEIHSIFEIRERHRGTLYLPDLELHFLELPKYFAWKKKTGEEHHLLAAWSRFFSSSEISKTELEQLIQQEPVMSKALKALEELSQDEEARQIAEAREKHRINLHIIRTEAEARGRAEGRAEGIVEGEARGEARGEAKGRAEGRAEGIVEAKREHIRHAAQAGLEPEKIAAIFQVSLEEVFAILKSDSTAIP